MADGPREVDPGATFVASFDTHTAGQAAQISASISGPDLGDTFLARTAPGDGVVENPAGSGIYERTFTAPTVAGAYRILWDNANGGPVTPANSAPEDFIVAWTSAVVAGDPVYATVADLRAELDDPTLDAAIANRRLVEAEDKVDSILGVYTIRDTGRKLAPAELADEDREALRRATVIIAAALNTDATAARSAKRIKGPDYELDFGDAEAGALYGGALARAGAILTGARLRRLTMSIR